MAVNANAFADLLNRKQGEVERPKPLPVGTYYAIVAGPPEFKSVGQNQTPVADFPIKLLRPGDDITPDMLDAAGIKSDAILGRKLNYRFFLTEDALYRLKDFVRALGVEEDDMTMGEAIARSNGQQFLATIVHRNFQDNRTNEMITMAEIGGAAKI